MGSTWLSGRVNVIELSGTGTNLVEPDGGRSGAPLVLV